MNTIKAALQADWAPAIESIARSLGWLIAAVIVLVQWAQFTWRRPWEGLLAVIGSPRSVDSSPRSRPTAPLLLAAAPEPVPSSAPPTRKRGRRATRQPKAVA